MPISLTVDLQNALDDPERYGVVLLTFQFGINVYGLWTGPGSQTYNTIPYLNGGQAIEADDIQQNSDGSVAEMKLKLNTNPDKGLTTDILQTFYDEDWQFGKVHIQLAMRHPTTGQIIGAATFIKGSIHEAPFTEGPNGAFIEARVVSDGIKMSESGGLYRNASTQQALDPTDTSLVGIGSLGGSIKKDLKWGQV